MEFTSSLLNTSLDLSIKPLKFFDEGPTPKQEVESHSSRTVGTGRYASTDEEKDALVEKLNRMSEENKKLSELITVMCQNYSELRNQLMEHGSKNLNEVDNQSSIITASRKRKAESSLNIVNSNENIGRVESSSSDEESSKKPKEEHIKAKISCLYFKTEPSDTTLIVKDGYQWRKYGQKVTRDNPCPRAYFKCALAPWCPVKKKVQRSVEDQSIVVATYEGEHIHPQPSSKLESTTNRASRIISHVTPSSSSGQTITLDLTQTKPWPRLEETRDAVIGKNDRSPQIQQSLVEQMASTLTRDPNFKAVLAAAISGQLLPQNHQT